MEDGTPITLEELYALVDAASGVIFDNDGTVVNTMPQHYISYVEALKGHGIVFPTKLFYELAGVPARDIIARLSRDQNIPVSVDSVLAAKSAVLEKLLPGVRAIEPAVAVLQYAKKKGLPVAIASGSDRNDVIQSLTGSQVGVDIFDAIVVREDVAKGKPDPETFLKAAQRLGVDPTKCIGFEDGSFGLQALEAAGMVAVDIRKVEGYPKPEELEKK